MRILCLLLLLCGFSASAQSYYGANELGITAGGSQYFGDLNDHYGFRFVRPAVGIFARHHMTPYIAVRANLMWTEVGYADSYNSNDFQKLRNLSFKSNVVELSAAAEFNFFRYATGEIGNRWTPYLTGGVGVFYYNPTAEINGSTYALRSLGTEGQNAGFADRKYSSYSVCFPIGMGVKYWIRPGLNLGFEIADRLTTTDYLDDVSRTYVGMDRFPNTDPLVPNPAALLQDRSGEVSPVLLGRNGKQRGNSTTFDQYLVFAFHLSILEYSVKDVPLSELSEGRVFVLRRPAATPGPFFEKQKDFSPFHVHRYCPYRRRYHERYARYAASGTEPQSPHPHL